MRVLIVVIMSALLILTACQQNIPASEYVEQNSEKVTTKVYVNPKPPEPSEPVKPNITADLIKTFKEVDAEVCTEDGKPVIRMFSSTTCPHCLWIKKTFHATAMEYVNEGKIVARDWELNTKDDDMTPEVETDIPESEIIELAKFDSKGYVPAYSFGCKYLRVGNGYELSGDRKAEELEFRAVIEELLKEVN